MKKMNSSIIVPVYNGEKYIRKCIESLLAQDFKDIEVIIVDDGSTDKTANICSEYKDERIRVIHQENKGVSEARNIGLSAATGDVILFVDVDDWVEPTFVSKMMEPFYDQNISMTACKLIREYTEQSIPTFLSKDFIGKISCNDAIRAVLLPKGIEGYLWNKAFRRSTIINIRIQFDKNISICEDVKFVISYILKSKMAYIIDECLYHYVQHEESARNQTIKSVNFNSKWLSEIVAWNNIVELLNKYESLQKIAKGRLALAATLYVKRMIQCNYEDKKEIEKLIQILRSNVIYALRFKVGNSRWRISAVLCALFPNIVARKLFLI